MFFFILAISFSQVQIAKKLSKKSIIIFERKKSFNIYLNFLFKASGCENPIKKPDKTWEKLERNREYKIKKTEIEIERSFMQFRIM